LTLGAGGRVIAQLTGKKRCSRRSVLRLFVQFGLPVYRTPLGSLVRREDVETVAMKQEWWRRVPTVGVLGESRKCPGSGESVADGLVAIEALADAKIFVAHCPICSRAFTRPSVLDSRGALRVRIPDHVAPTT
jgi:hypothetical protein